MPANHPLPHQKKKEKVEKSVGTPRIDICCSNANVQAGHSDKMLNQIVLAILCMKD